VIPVINAVGMGAVRRWAVQRAARGESDGDASISSKLQTLKFATHSFFRKRRVHSSEEACRAGAAPEQTTRALASPPRSSHDWRATSLNLSFAHHEAW
jgi:hypothetical protein